jgi:transcriptional regulator with XRE-family HTH domain
LAARRLDAQGEESAMGRVNRAPTIFDIQASYRWRYPPMRRFAADLGRLLQHGSLSRQTIYQWESGRTIVPASVLLAASELVDMPLDEVLTMAHRMATIGGANQRVNG